MLNNRLRLAAQDAFKLEGGISPGCSISHFHEGSLTSWEKMTALAAASGRLAHQRCRVLGCPCRMDFSRADALLIASSGSATSISFFGDLMVNGEGEW